MSAQTMVTYGNATNYNWSTYPHPLYGGRTSNDNQRLTKEGYMKKVQLLLDDCRQQIEDLRDKSMRIPLKEEELEQAFAVLYDAADLVRSYQKKTKCQRDEPLVRTNQDNWILPYMKDLILYGVGSTAEITEIRGEPLETLTGKRVVGNIIRVRILPIERRSNDVPLYNWLEVDEYFWDQDYKRAEYEYTEYGYLPYDEKDITIR